MMNPWNLYFSWCPMISATISIQKRSGTGDNKGSTAIGNEAPTQDRNSKILANHVMHPWSQGSSSTQILVGSHYYVPINYEREKIVK